MSTPSPSSVAASALLMATAAAVIVASGAGWVALATATPAAFHLAPPSRRSMPSMYYSRSTEPMLTSCSIRAAADERSSSSRLLSTKERNKRRIRGEGLGDAFGDFDDDYGYGDDHDIEEDDNYDDEPHDASPHKSQTRTDVRKSEASGAGGGGTFYSQKSLADPSFSLEDDAQFFRQLCVAAKITQPSRIQSLAWPVLLRGEDAVVADQTGSGKTLAYLLPSLQRLCRSDATAEGELGGATLRKKKRTGSPRLVVLAPTAELADQIHSVCSRLSKDLARSSSWSFRPFVTTAAGSKSTNIRDQIRLLRSTPVDVLISTPGRLSTILRTKNAGLDLSNVMSLVLDEVDFLLVDETFGPQLRAVGVAVQGGDAADGDGEDDEGRAQFVFVTATLPTDVLKSIKDEFPKVTEVRGPGLHRIAQSVRQTLVDVSVPATSNRDPRACFDIKVTEMLKALRGRRCKRTLVFCNTVQTCRDVENTLRRRDRRGRRSRVWAYHNALAPDVRLKNLRDFSAGGLTGDGEDDGAERVLVCTDRAARGVDFDSSPVDHVLLFDFPKDPAEYVRRVGRTARAGREGASTVLAYGWQLPIARKIMGIGGDIKGGKKGKKGNAKLESFNMMRYDDGWEEEEAEDKYYIQGGARRRKEITTGKGGGANGGGKNKRGGKKGGGRGKM